MVGIDQGSGSSSLYQVSSTEKLTKIFQFSTTYFDVGNGLPGPMTVNADDNISIGAYTQYGAGTFLPATYLFVTTGPVPNMEPLPVASPVGTAITAEVNSTLPIAYQRSLNGAAEPGATSASISPSSQGTYTVLASTSAGSVTSSTSAYTSVPLQVAYLANISCRCNVGAGGNIAIAGFVMSGSANEQVLIRGVGPTLSQFSVSGVLAQPVLAVYNSSGVEIAADTGWGNNSKVAQITAAFTSTGAFSLPPGKRRLRSSAQPSPTSATGSEKGLFSGVRATQVVDLRKSHFPKGRVVPTYPLPQGRRIG